MNIILERAMISDHATLWKIGMHIWLVDEFHNIWVKALD